jgi:hypothetical protein
MQRQLEKMTDLVRLIVQKMQIPAEMEVDDTSKGDKNESWTKLQKLRQSINVTRRISHMQSSTSNTLSYDLLHTENA